MSLISKAEKNLTNLSPRLENVGTLKNIPVVLSDSKGRYLKDQTVDKHPERKIVWWIHPGTTVQQNLQWLKEKAVKTFQDLGQIHITLFIWLGTCDLTFKTGKYIFLKSSDFQVVTDLCQGLRDIYTFIHQFPTVRLIFLQVPFYSIYWWNKFHNHPDPDQFLKKDDILHEQLLEVNKYIITLNEFLGQNSPDFNLDILASRKRHYDLQTSYSTSFALYLDGIHPSPTLAKLWLLRLCLRLNKDCN